MLSVHSRAVSAGFVVSVSLALLTGCSDSASTESAPQFTSVASEAPETELHGETETSTTTTTSSAATSASQPKALRPDDYFPSEGTEANVTSPFHSDSGPDAVRYIASADENVACDLYRLKFKCGVFSYAGGEPYGSGSYSGNHIVHSDKDAVTDSNELGTAAMYGIRMPDPVSAPPPQIVQPGEIVYFDGNYCQGLDDGLMCWNVSTRTGRTIQRAGTDFWTFTF